MSDEKKSYRNAGSQSQQARLEVRKYGELAEDALITLKTVSLVLDINRNKVNQIPVQHRLIDKRKYYRKGDISDWVVFDAKQPESLLQKLREEHVVALEKIAKQPSRRYSSGALGKAEAKSAKDRTKANKINPFSRD